MEDYKMLIMPFTLLDVNYAMLKINVLSPEKPGFRWSHACAEEQAVEKPVVHVASAEQSREDSRLHTADNADEWVRYEGDVIFALPVHGNGNPIVETQPLLEVTTSIAIFVERGHPSLQFVYEHKDAASGLSQDLGDGFHRDVLDAELLCLRLLPLGFGGSLAPFFEAVLILLDT